MPAARALLLLFAAALILGAQQQSAGSKTAATPEIRGVVVEPGTNRPVEEAEVSYWMPKVLPGGLSIGGVFTTENPLGTAKTGPDGAFRFAPAELGDYYVRVLKEGYGNAGPFNRGPTTSASVTLTAIRPLQELHFVLALPAQISGRLVDEETGKPIAKYPMSAWQDNYYAGNRIPMRGASAATDEEGRFVLKGVTPTEYLLGVSPRIASGAWLMKTFSKEDLDVVDLDYVETYWPGGHDPDSAVTYPLGAGDALDAGVLKVRMGPFYRVHVSFPKGMCGPGEEVTVVKAKVPPKGSQGQGPVPCEDGVLMSGFTPGSYQLMIDLLGKGDNAERQHGSAVFQVVDRNVDVPIAPARGVDVSVKVVAADGASLPPLNKMQIRMQADVGGVVSLGAQTVPDPEGNIRFANLPPRENRLSIRGVPGSHYVKAVRYNGSAVRGNPSELVFALDPSAASHSVVIEVDDKPAFVTGVVTERERPVGQPYVVLMPWPLRDPGSIWPIPSTTGDADGKFQFAGLAPGEYRILAVSSAVRYEFNKPSVLERLLATAKKVGLSPRGNQNLTLELTELH
jgi:hypothetical protein